MVTTQFKNLRQYLVLIGSFLASLFLSLIPLPENLAWARPQWTVLILIYWVLSLPPALGLCLAWLWGFWVDVFMETGLGHHGLVFLAMAFLIQVLRRRLTYLSPKQSLTWIIPLLGLGQGLSFVLTCLQGETARWTYHMTLWGINALVWPLVYAVLNHSHRAFEKSIQ